MKEAALEADARWQEARGSHDETEAALRAAREQVSALQQENETLQAQLEEQEEAEEASLAEKEGRIRLLTQQMHAMELQTTDLMQQVSAAAAPYQAQLEALQEQLTRQEKQHQEQEDKLQMAAQRLQEELAGAQRKERDQLHHISEQGARISDLVADLHLARASAPTAITSDGGEAHHGPTQLHAEQMQKQHQQEIANLKEEIESYKASRKVFIFFRFLNSSRSLM